ncbi:hemolysin family protein [bacterium]|nr:hemolysin family protein [bacterium]
MLPLAAFAVVALLLLSAIWLGALTEFSRSRLERYCARRQRDMLGKILAHDDEVVLALRLWNRLLLLALAAVIYLHTRSADSASWLAYFALFSLAAVLLENGVARPIGEAFAEPILYWSWTLLNLLRLAIYPVVWLESGWSEFIHRFSTQDDPGTSPLQEEIRTVVNEGEREGQVMPEAVDMIAGLMDLHQVEVGQIMTPRTDLEMFPIQTTIQDARQKVAESGHSRVPVYGSNRDDIVGVLYAKDLLPHLENSATADLSFIQLRQPLYVPYSKPVDILLREFQKGGIHLAIVLDDYGGVAGLVTIEDIMEEIVGDIRDEYDEDERPPIERIDEQSFNVDARLDIDSVNEAIPLQIPEGEDYDTLGGFVANILGRIPHQDESFEHAGFQFTILEATDRAIGRIRIRPISTTNHANPE